MMHLKIHFPDPPSGISDNWNSDTKVSGFDLTLSQSEAIQVATALLEFAHLPNAREEETRWMSIEEMPALSDKIYKKVKLEKVESSLNQFNIINRTEYHLGTVDIEFSYTYNLNGDNQIMTSTIIYSVDLPPRQTRRIIVNSDDLTDGSFYFGFKNYDATITRVTGFDLASML